MCRIGKMIKKFGCKENLIYLALDFKETHACFFKISVKYTNILNVI